MKRVLSIQKGVFALLLALFLGMGTAYAYDFSVVVSGKTFYFNLIDATHHYVEVTYPGTYSNPYGGFTKPTGNISIPDGFYSGSTLYTVTKIGDRAFYGCSGLTGSLTIPSTVNSIGVDAFYNCSGFSGSLSVPNSVTTIGSWAFSNCGFTGSLTIGNGVTEIGAYAFYQCVSFTGSLTLGSSVTSIGQYAFQNCAGFTGSLTIPSSVTTIGNNAFQNCFGFTGTLTLGSSLTSIGDKAFYNCNKFTGSLTIPSSVTTIGESAFYNCRGFTGSLSIPNSVTTIGSEAFYYCNGFTGILTIGTGVTSIGASAFKNCTGFTQVKYNAINCANLTSDTKPFEGCTATTLTIGSGVQRIPAYMFYECSNFTGTLTIPNSVTTIGNGAFFECYGFTGSLTIPNSVTTIGVSAFGVCTGITGTLTLGNSVTTISPLAFQGCGFTGTLTIPSSVTALYFYAFQYCQNFTQINYNAVNCADVTSTPFNGCSATTLTIGSGVQRIPAKMFEECSNFTGTLTIPTTVTEIGASAFKNCTGFTQVKFNAINCADVAYNAKPFEDCTATTLTIGSSVQRIPANMFRDCSNFTGTLTIPSSVTEIGNGAFRECTGMTGSLDIPESVTSIGNYAFYDCHSFTGTLTLPNSLTEIGTSVFENCYGFHGFLTLPNSVTMIYDNAFAYCAGFMGSLTIPNSVTYIGSHAFEHCEGMTGMLTIGSSVTEIAGYAFGGCSNFSSMTVYPETPPDLSPWVFQNIPTSIPMYVPCASLEDYQSAYGWSNFTNIQCIPETLTVHDWTVTNDFVPVYGYWADAYLKAEFVMPASELADMAGGTITSMKFYASQADVSWGNANFQVFLTEVSDATISAFTGPGTVVYQGALSIVGGEMTVDFTTPYQYNGGNLLVGIYNTVKGSYATSTWYGESVTGASVQGYSSSSLSAVSPTQRNFIPKTTFGYTPSPCSRPKDLTETDITFNSAKLHWTRFEEDGELRYRKKPFFYEDFADGLPSGWTTIDNDGDGYNWHSMINNGSTYMASASYDSNIGILTPDNWLITPQLELQGTMKVWLRALNSSYAQEHFAIYLSTTGTNVSDFTTVLVPETTLNNADYHTYAADLSAYEGQQGYIAIRHFNCSDMFELLLDYFGLFDNLTNTGEIGEWNTLYEVVSGYTLTALEPETEYEWQVRGFNCDGNGSYTEWSGIHSFVTTPFNLCPPEDQCELTFTLTDSYGDGWNSAAILVVDVETDIVLASMANENLDGAYDEETQILTLAVCDGRELRFEWYPGGWDSECSYTVTDVNGIEIFSGTGAMSAPVTYMVNCAPIQTIALSSGANWVSFNVELTLDDLKAALVEAVPNTEITIQEQNNNVKYNPNTHRWTGRLTELDLSKMYKISVADGCVLTLEGAVVDPADHPATIGFGANWIAFPLREEKTPSEAFAGFAQSGDKVQSQTQNASYNGTRWTGRLTTLEPGQGYIYQSGVSEDRVFSFTHGYVDLGLPSGLLWATCNVGAYSPEEYGDYFAWGETTPKDIYNWSTYQYCMGSENTLTKYCNDASYGYNGFTDDLTTLLPEDDAATANWGSGWRMPTKEEWQELYNNTTVTCTQQNGVIGDLFTASNGNSLFLPAAGSRVNSGLSGAGSWGNYWSGSLRINIPYYAWSFYFNSDGYDMYYYYRYYGRSVRAVRVGSQN